jgi:hypothetical protein
MSLATLTFKFYTDTSLTSAFSNLYQLTHKTDLSDNPQTFTLYFGSATANRLLQASSNPGVDQITLTPTKILPVWTANTVYTLGQTRSPTVDNTYRYEITTAGTSHATTEPTWPTGAIGNTVVDGSCIWTLVSKEHPITEIKLALTEGGLTGATAGAALNLGTSISSLAANKVTVWMKVTNSVTTVESNTGTPEIGLYINAVQESAV